MAKTKATHFAQNSTSVRPNIIVDGINGLDQADYGGSFTNYTPPDNGLKSDTRAVNDTNGAGASRIYVKAGDVWFYISATKV